MQRGLIQIYTGDGKGKTTAALGLALRALGAGLKVYLGQFIKRGEFSEIKALRRFKPKIIIRQYGCGRFIKGKPSPADIQCARRGLTDLKRAMLSEAPRGKPRGIFAELRRSYDDEPAVAEAMAGRLAIHPRGKPRGTLAKASRKYDLIIADEINCAVKAGLITTKEVLQLIDKKPSDVELILTGRNAPRQIMKRADLITEMKKIRHPFDRGAGGRRGIEF